MAKTFENYFKFVITVFLIDLAEIQLSLLNMGSQETPMNPTQATEFITGDSLSSTRMGAKTV